MVDLAGASVSLAGLAIVFFLAISMLTRDVHQRSVCMILSRPVSRTCYVIGKFGGLALMVLAATLLIACTALITSAFGIRFLGQLEIPRNFSFGHLGLIFLLKYISLLILLAIAFLCTVVTTNEFLSMLLTMIIYFIGNSLETIVKVASAGSDVQIGTLYLNALKVCTWIFPNLAAFDFKMHLAYGLQLPYSQILWTLIYGLFYILSVISLSAVVFNRREIR